MLIYLRLFLIISSISSSCWCAAVLISHCNLRLVSNLLLFFLIATLLGESWKKVEDKHSSDTSSMLPQNILSQTSRHNDRDYRLPRAETHSSSTPVQHPIKPVVHPTATPSTVPPSPFSLQSDHQPKKSFDANGASTLSKLSTSTSSVPAQKTERKGMSDEIPSTIQDYALHYIACLKYVSTRI